MNKAIGGDKAFLQQLLENIKVGIEQV